MTANKHTPAPWSVGTTDPDTAEIEIVSEGRPYICLALPGAVDGRTEANARLIAAAPEYFDGTADLLAYEDAVEAGDDVQAMLLYASAVNKLRAAHLKATGGAA